MIMKFLRYETLNKGLTERTTQEYYKDLRHFAAWAQPQGLRWSTIKKRDLDRYVAEESERGLKPETIKKRMTAIRCIYRYFVHEHLLQESPAEYVVTPKRFQSLPKVTTYEAIDRWLQAPTKNCEEAETKALAALLMESGLRIHEALTLRWSDFKDGNRIVVRGKCRKERMTFYAERTSKLLMSRAKTDGYVFTARSDRYYRERLTYFAEAYVPGIHPHMLRHTFATELLAHGIELKTLSCLLGHEDIHTTERYTHVAAANLQQAYLNSIN